MKEDVYSTSFRKKEHFTTLRIVSEEKRDAHFQMVFANTEIEFITSKLTLQVALRINT